MATHPISRRSSLLNWLTEELFGERRSLRWLIAGLVVLQGAIAVLVYWTGGTAYVFVQLMYLPIMLGGLVLGFWGGVGAGLLGGLLVGPLMPLNLHEGTSQATYAWLLRLIFFVLVGLVSGGASGLLYRRMRLINRVADELSLAYGHSLKTLANLLNERDDRTADHSERVAYNADLLGRALGLGAEGLETLHWAAILHDIGKIAVPEAVLNKPGPLTPEEREQMRRHVEIGARILLSASPEFAPIAQALGSHHERFDGTGYPSGLKGGQIPLPARIVSVLDVFEALTSKRPYRDPMTPAEALNFVRQGAETQFDPRVVEVFTRLYEGKKLVLGEAEGRSPSEDSSISHLRELFRSRLLQQH